MAIWPCRANHLWSCDLQGFVIIKGHPARGVLRLVFDDGTIAWQNLLLATQFDLTVLIMILNMKLCCSPWYTSDVVRNPWSPSKSLNRTYIGVKLLSFLQLSLQIDSFLYMGIILTTSPTCSPARSPQSFSAHILSLLTNWEHLESHKHRLYKKNPLELLGLSEWFSCRVHFFLTLRPRSVGSPIRVAIPCCCRLFTIICNHMSEKVAVPIESSG